MDVAHGLAGGRGLIEGLFFQLLDAVLVVLALDGLEVVFLFVDGLFFEDSHAGGVAEELTNDFRFGRVGLGVRRSRRSLGLAVGFVSVRSFRGVLLHNLLFFNGGIETQFADGRFHAVRR